MYKIHMNTKRCIQNNSIKHIVCKAMYTIRCIQNNVPKTMYTKQCIQSNV